MINGFVFQTTWFVNPKRTKLRPLLPYYKPKQQGVQLPGT